MSKSVEVSGRSVDDAVQAALEQLDASIDDVVVEVLDEGDSGILGIGRRPARVQVTLDAGDEAPVLDSDALPYVEDDVYDEDEVDEPAEDEADELDADYYGDQVSEELSADDDELGAKAVRFIQTILEAMDVEADVYSEHSGENLTVEIEGDDVGAVIGRRGDTLNAIQYLTSLMINRKTDEHIYLTVDVGGYRARRKQALIDLAERTANRVVEVGKEYVMEPLPAAERRIVHTALQEWPGIRTESEGAEPHRSVIIIPTGD